MSLKQLLLLVLLVELLVLSHCKKAAHQVDEDNQIQEEKEEEDALPKKKHQQNKPRKSDTDLLQDITSDLLGDLEEEIQYFHKNLLDSPAELAKLNFQLEQVKKLYNIKECTKQAFYQQYYKYELDRIQIEEELLIKKKKKVIAQLNNTEQKIEKFETLLTRKQDYLKDILKKLALEKKNLANWIDQILQEAADENIEVKKLNTSELIFNLNKNEMIAEEKMNLQESLNQIDFAQMKLSENQYDLTAMKMKFDQLYNIQITKLKKKIHSILAQYDSISENIKQTQEQIEKHKVLQNECKELEKQEQILNEETENIKKINKINKVQHFMNQLTEI